jgi:hypothetical protein
VTGGRSARVDGRGRSARATWRVTAALVGVLVVAGCTGDDAPSEPEATASASATAASDGGPEWTADELMEAVQSREEKVLGSVEGDLAFQEEPVPVRFDVLGVAAGDEGTVLRLRMTHLGGSGVQAMPRYLNPDAMIENDIRNIALQVPEQSIRFEPTLATLDSDPDEVEQCLCSDLSQYVDPATPFLFTATFPALDPATRTVDVELNGFPLIEGIAVDRG